MIAKGQTIGTFDAGAQASHSEYAKAILLIIFSYEGWENAAFVAGEIPRNRHYVLRRGFLSAVFVVGILYITLVAIFLYGLLDYTSDGSTSTIRTDVSFAPLLFGGSVAAEKAFGVLIAISAIGSVISIVYTFARVKQAIGHMNILPWSRLWKADDRQHANNYHSDLERSPMGGLILHALTTIIVISATAAIPNIIDAISFPGIMQTYAHSIISIVVALGLPRLRFRAELLGFDDEDDLANWHALDRKLIRPWHSEKWYAVVPLILLLLVYAACNLFVVIEYCIPPYNGVDGWVPLLIFGILTVAAVIYYFAIFASFFLRELPPRSGERRKHGFSILKWVNTTVQIEKTEEFDMFSSDARRFGKRRSITYRHAVGGNWWVYWLFGGEVAPPSPWEDLMTALDSLKFWRRW
ncbi:hypothetical protein MMC25_000913 [Agyrium rufum]|nr:hypothetical protein [Agyrium rufum]